jgi:superfamily II DNA/RNA helicase
MNFSELGLGDGVLKAVADAGYSTPTPIQEKAIPIVLMGRDILGCAQTGTGKTASFTLPMIDILASGRAKARMPRSLILEPTRELAAQVADNFDTYGKYHKLSKALLIGGSSMNDQLKVIDRGPDVLIATPGRLLDLFERGRLLMTDIKTLVIDEADRMLDMGFIPEVEKIVSLISPMRQTLFFSATLAPEIKRLADKFLMNPKEITVAPPATSAETITQGLVMVSHDDGKRPGGGQKEKRIALREMIARENVKDALIFCNRKRDIATLHKSMTKHGFSVGQLHGDMSQPARMEMLTRFKNSEFTFMICSDVAARGLDIPALSHVFNFDVPSHAEDYVHRIGRTGRAGIEGHAYTIAVPEDRQYIEAITKLIGRKIPPISEKSVKNTNAAKTDGASPAPDNASAKKSVVEANIDTSSVQPQRSGRNRGSGRDHSRSKEPKAEKANESQKEQIHPKTTIPNKPNQANDFVKFGDTDHVPAFMQRPKSK